MSRFIDRFNDWISDWWGAILFSLFGILVLAFIVACAVRGAMWHKDSSQQDKIREVAVAATAAEVTYQCSEEVKALPNRFIVTHSNLISAEGKDREVLILRDIQTGVEYLAVMGSGVTEIKRTGK